MGTACLWQPNQVVRIPLVYLDIQLGAFTSLLSSPLLPRRTDVDCVEISSCEGCFTRLFRHKKRYRSDIDVEIFHQISPCHYSPHFGPTGRTGFVA